MGAHPRAVAAKLVGTPLPTPGMIDKNTGAGLIGAGAKMSALRTAELTHR
jgi:hypothetical protein